MWEEVRRKLTEEAGENRQLKMMAMQTCDLIEKTGDVGLVLASDKTLEELKKKFDDFASKHKEGNQAVIMPDEAEQLICEYYGIHESHQQDGGIIDIMDLM